MTENLTGCEIVFDGCKWGVIDEDLGDSVIVCDQDGGDHLVAKSRIDSVTKLYVEHGDKNDVDKIR